MPIVELHDAASLAPSERLARLGPDPLGDRFDPAVAAARLRATNATIEEALLDQRAIARMGYVLKSECILTCRPRRCRARS